MKKKKMSIKGSLYLTLLIFLALGIAFVGATIGILIRLNYVKNNFIEIEAVISYIDYTDHDDNDAYVTFIPEGETSEVEIKLNSYSSSYYVGKKINIYYNPANYNEISEPKTLQIVSLVFFIIGVLLILLGFIPLIIFGSISARAKYYKKHFKKQSAKILSINTNYVVAIGNAHPRVINYKTKDGIVLKTTDYSSRFVNFEEGLVIDVYKNDKNGKYYADPESIRKDEFVEEDIFSIDNDKF